MRFYGTLTDLFEEKLEGRKLIRVSLHLHAVYETRGKHKRIYIIYSKYKVGNCSNIYIF